MPPVLFPTAAVTNRHQSPTYQRHNYLTVLEVKGLPSGSPWRPQSRICSWAAQAITGSLHSVLTPNSASVTASSLTVALLLPVSKNTLSYIGPPQASHPSPDHQHDPIGKALYAS